MKIKKERLEKYFEIQEEDEFYRLRYKKGINTIRIKKDFEFDEDVASLAGLMPDGSLIKDLKRVYFHQKKDMKKIFLFKDLIQKLFQPNNRIFMRDNRGTWNVYANSQTLVMFLYKMIGIPKSDQQMRIPRWVFSSRRKVKIAYLKQAYDMEGTILKKLTEIRFITKDEKFGKDIQQLLTKLSITSTRNPRIGGTHKTRQYRISVYKKENFKKFKEIGFSIEGNAQRFEKLVERYGI